MASNDFRPPIASPPERPPATIEQINNRDPVMDFGTWQTAKPPMGRAIPVLPIGAKRGNGA